MFADNFWGDGDHGVDVIIARMKNGKHATAEVVAMFKERASIEEEFGKRLARLAKSFTTNEEIGTLRESLDLVKSELETSARAHLDIANEIRVQLEKPMTEFITQQSGTRKTHHSGVERRLKNKANLAAAAAKAKARYTSKCHEVQQLSIPQQNLTKEAADKLQNKLEKAQHQATQYDLEYLSAVERLADSHSHWEQDFRTACNEFQRLEEERIEYVRGRLWAYTNIISTLCVSDDESCERIRQSLERCDVKKDIRIFVESKRTGTDIPAPLPYVNHYSGTSERVAPPAVTHVTASSLGDVHSPSTSTSPIPRNATLMSTNSNGAGAGGFSQFSTMFKKTGSDKGFGSGGGGAAFGSLFRKGGGSQGTSAAMFAVRAKAATAAGAIDGTTSPPLGGDDDFVYDPFDFTVEPTQLFEVRVLYDYASQAPEELSVTRGQVLPVIAQHEDGSVYVILGGGRLLQP
ncbi:hypothetical protein HDU82_007806 [Entophlyctis luteolus]|nr:hypothetical protein HDU82_007806 [Entophlyctis luteolus]